MWTCGSTCIARYSNLLTSLNDLTFLDIYLAQVHIDTLELSSILLVICDLNHITGSLSIAGRNDLTLIFCRIHWQILVSSCDVYASM